MTTRDKINVVGDVHHPESLTEVWRDDVYRARDRLRPGAIVVDLGANVGAFSIWAATMGCCVWAIEPLWENVKQLRLNIDRTGAKNVKIKQAAAGHDGQCRIQRGVEPTAPGWSTGAHALPGTDVPMLSLDTIIAAISQDIDILKVDIEGSEYDLIANAESLSRVAYIAMETHAWRPIGSAPDGGRGERDGEMPVDGLERLTDKLSKTHSITSSGSIDGGMLWAERWGKT